MIPKISRGGKAGGLVVYLLGPGKHNEHFDRHLIAASPVLLHEQWTGVFNDAGDRQSESRRVALELGRAMDLPRLLHEVKVTKWASNVRVAGEHGRGLDTIVDPKPGEDRVKRDAHVWHCSLSLKPEEGVLSDEKWSAIVGDFMREMGFDDPDKAGARWVAVRHGLARNGGDHVHIAASLVREDGSVVDTYFRDPDNGNKPRGDRGMAHQVVNMLEHRYGLEVLTSREEGGRGVAGASAAEIERQAREQRPETERDTLRRLVRAYAGAAVSEHEFVRGLRMAGVAIWPRWAAGGQDEVVGYTVQLRRDGAPQGPRMGGGRLSADLSLTALREQAWIDSPEGRAEAVALWRRGNRDVTGPDEGGEKVDATELWQRAAAEAREWQTRLAEIPIGDHAQWKWVAGQAAAVYAAWSVQIEGDDPGAFAAAARELTRSAQTRYAGQRHRPPNTGARNVGMGDIARKMISVWQRSGHTAQRFEDVGADAAVALVALGVALVALMITVAAAHRARDELARALDVEHAARERLEAVHRGWSEQLAQRRDRIDLAKAQELVGPKPGTRAAQRRERFLDMDEVSQQRYLMMSFAAPDIQPKRWTSDLLTFEYEELGNEATELRQHIAARRAQDGPLVAQAMADNAELAARAEAVASAKAAEDRAQKLAREQRGLSAQLTEAETTLSQTSRLRVRVRDQLREQVEDLTAKIGEIAPRVEAARQGAADAATKTRTKPEDWDDITRRGKPEAQARNLEVARSGEQAQVASADSALSHVDYELRLVEHERGRRASLTPAQDAAERPFRINDRRAGTRPNEQSRAYVRNPTLPSRSGPDLTQDRDRGGPER